MNQNSGTGVIADTLNWFTKPFNSQGSALNWILFVGLLIVAAWFWHVILRDVLGGE